MKNLKEKIVAGFIIIWLIGVMLSCFVGLSHGSVRPRPNSLGVPETYESPYTYMLGAIHDVSVMQEDGKVYTNVAFAPYGASLLDTESVLFCGEVDNLDARTKVYVYDKTPHRMFHGVPCHELKTIFVVEGQ